MLRTLRVGICGSDLHSLRNGIIHPHTGSIVTTPMVVGHEPCAKVVEVGPEVTHLTVGDIVSIEPNVPCRECFQCRAGRFYLCSEMKVLGWTHDGAACRYFTFFAKGCYKLPEEITPEEGALIEPLSVGINACRRAGIQFGMTVLITGAGPIGFMVLLTAKAFGASRVVMTDTNEKRLQMAKNHGVDAIIVAKASEPPQDVAKRAAEAIGDKFDVTFDCVGFESTVETGIHATRPGGKLVVLGLGAERVNIPLVKAVMSGIDIISSIIYTNTWPFCIRMLQEKRVAVKSLATHIFKLENALEAFEFAKKGEGIKIMINCED